MRVLVAHDIRAARTGGMSRIMGFIHDRIAPRGYELDYLHAEDVPSGVRALRRFSFPLGVYERARREARKNRPYAILNIHEPSALACVVRRGSIGNPAVVLTTHGVEQRAWELALEERRLGRSGPSLKTRIVYPLSSLWQSSLSLRRADHILCLNEEDRRYLTDRFGVRQDRITRIFPGADPVFAEAARDRHYARAEKLLFAGTWRKNKGIEDLVPAFTELVRTGPRIELVVLGAGVPDSEVRAAFPHDVRDSVRCMTVGTEPETAAVFAAADLFVLPSLFEGTPLTLIEAMMSGLPIVTTAVCGMKDVIETGRNGMLVPIRSAPALAAAVRDLVAHPEKRRQLGTAARTDARTRYTWELSADRVAAVYAELTGRAWRGAARAS